MSHNLFNDVIYNSIPSNSFDLSHDRKMSMKMGKLYPILTQEVVPGDHFNVQQEQLIRLSPLVSPVMHRVNVTTHFFFVPNRLLWEGWTDFIANPTDPLNPAPYVRPLGEGFNSEVGSIADFLGYPTGNITAGQLNPLPMSAYNLIWNEYYRDQNLQEPKEYKLVDGVNTEPDIVNQFNDIPYTRAWEKDYFTSALPFPQKGEAVTLSLGTSAPIQYKDGSPATVIRNTQYPTAPFPIDGQFKTTAPNVINILGTESGGTKNGNVNVDNSANLEVDLTSLTAVTVEDLRRATRLQEWLEINARSGTRYIESIQSHFGVKSQDSRLQRPEFLGGGKSNVAFSEVLQTSSSDSETPQGNMAGHGINVGNSHAFKSTFQEHGFIIGIMSVMPDTAYMNPTPKWATRLDPLEYLWPSFAQLGEQPVYNYELMGDYPNATSQEIFGYQSRYADYKYNHNTVHGEFKTNLDFWHMARKLTGSPVLNAEFIESDPTTRIFAVEDPEVDNLYVHLYNRITARRPLPRYNIPTL